MKPVAQTNGEVGKGDCFRACVASILEVAIDELPADHFVPDRDDWFERASNFLCDRFGLYLVKCGVSTLAVDKDGDPVVCVGDYAFPQRGLWIATVNSINLPPSDDGEPRRHAIVMNGLNLVWDPSTSKKRADFGDDTPIYFATMLAPVDPARHPAPGSEIA